MPDNPTRREWRAANPPREPWRRMVRCPPHPGEILRDHIEGHGIKQEAAAAGIGVTRGHLNRILNGRSDIGTEMAFRLSRALGTTVEFWLNLQRAHDIWTTYDRLGGEIDAIPLMPEVERTMDQPMFVDAA